MFTPVSSSDIQDVPTLTAVQQGALPAMAARHGDKLGYLTRLAKTAALIAG